LLVAAAHGLTRRLANNSYNRDMIHFGIIKPVQQMNCPGAGRGQADADLAGKFCVGASHEGGHFLMTRLDEFHAMGIFFRPFERADNSIDAISGVAKDSSDSPLMKPFDQKVRAGFAHNAIVQLFSCHGTFPRLPPFKKRFDSRKLHLPIATCRINASQSSL
jgi:hypothetical protein